MEEINVLGAFRPMALAYAKPATEDDINLVEQIAYLLEECVSPYAKKCFLSDPDIAGVVGLSSVAERFIINKYFVNVMLIYRGVGGNRVDLVMGMLANDGELEDYYNINKHIVFPFMRDNKIFETIYSPGV